MVILIEENTPGIAHQEDEHEKDKESAYDVIQVQSSKFKVKFISLEFRVGGVLIHLFDGSIT
jgi:hypothetical protein